VVAAWTLAPELAARAASDALLSVSPVRAVSLGLPRCEAVAAVLLVEVVWVELCFVAAFASPAPPSAAPLMGGDGDELRAIDGH
jgi:hypothetical protein